MKKIPTLFERDWDGNRSRVLPGDPKIDLAGAFPTRKLDGTCAMLRDGILYRRYDAKQGRTPPPGFELVEEDEITGHRIGWVPVGAGPEDRWFREAPQPDVDGTYELIGPKVQGNPEHAGVHSFSRHGAIQIIDCPTDYEGLAKFLSDSSIEGVVWWRDGEPVAKIKRRDFGLPWPIPVRP